MLRGRDGGLERALRVGVLRAQVDVALRRADRERAMVMPSISTNGSPSMIMRSEKVPESPSSALQTTYFDRAGRVQHGAPLDAGGEGGAAASAQAGLDDGFDDVGAAEGERVAQAPPAAVGFVVGEC